VADEERCRRFERIALPHLDAAHNLARWLTGNPDDADDVVQEAFLRAFRYFDAFRGGNFKIWLLTIVRNTCITWMGLNRARSLVFQAPDEMAEPEDGAATELLWGGLPKDPEALLLRTLDSRLLASLISRLAPEFREILILREMEGLSYREIATVAEIPMGTVMSRLGRARQQLRQFWQEQIREDADNGV
jgi:RNA polymerase sigma-70 factor (ECF subfamily)